MSRRYRFTRWVRWHLGVPAYMEGRQYWEQILANLIGLVWGHLAEDRCRMCGAPARPFSACQSCKNRLCTNWCPF